MAEIRDEHLAFPTPFVISGCIGPQGDGYSPEEILSAEAAQEYHSTQINTFAGTEADMVTAITMTYADEAIGIARAAREAGMPVVLSFTVETDGRLPCGQGLGRGDRGGRRRHRRLRRLLHDQLRAPDPLRRRPRRRGTLGTSAFGVSARTPRR